MAEFVEEYAALRWSVVLAFLLASVIVLVRLAAPVGAPSCGNAVVPQADSSQCHESDAAHLIMCLVMLVMLVFPMGANPQALRGVLVAMIVVFAALVVDAMVQWRSVNRGFPVDRVVALGYHIVVAAAMLFAISGHAMGGHTGGPAIGPALGLAALFTADTLAVVVAASTGRWRRWLGHPIGAGSFVDRALSSAMVPHIVMDLGTAYMLVAAVSR